MRSDTILQVLDCSPVGSRWENAGLERCAIINPMWRVVDFWIATVFVASILAGSSLAVAATGSVTHLSGVLSVKKADGAVRILSQKSEIENGDVLTTERGSYAQMRFSDGTQMTMKPNASIKIEDVKFAEDRLQEDSFVFGLLKGGLRTVTGLIGRRNRDKVAVNTATSTIGIRGTTFIVDDCLKSGGGDECKNLEPGIYLNVVNGQIIVRNDAGSEVFSAGQFGLVKQGERPVFLPVYPGLKFAPPETFRSAVTGGGAAVNTGQNLECVVRP